MNSAPKIELRWGDCLDIMPTLEAQSFDAIIADIPYGTTACSWDSVIPFAPMWEQLKRLAKPRAAIVLFGSQPFTSALIASNFEMFKYEWIWVKSKASNHVNANLRPMGKHENILVFSHGTIANCSPNLMNYYPQGLREINRNSYRPSPKFGGVHGKRPSHQKSYIQKYEGYPSTVLEFSNPNNSTEHPTQKPIDLMEYLVRTYTNEGDTVLDFTMGSGTTLIACVNTNRNGVGIEKELGYFESAQRDINDALGNVARSLGESVSKRLSESITQESIF